MILRVRNDENGWAVFGGIKKYDYRRIPLDTEEIHDNAVDEIFFIKHNETRDDGKIPFIEISLFNDYAYDSEKVYSIRLNTDAYICDDRGNTIEKIS